MKGLKAMKDVEFHIGITNNHFNWVAEQQKLAAHEAIGEPIDNALANAQGQAIVLVSVDSVANEPELIRFTIADWGTGMNAESLINALQFGSPHTNESYLCVEGVGLCNFLLVMSRNKFEWLIASKTAQESEYNIVKSPFSTEMEATSGDLPLSDIVIREKLSMHGKPSTVVSVVTDKWLASTMLAPNGNCFPPEVKSLDEIRLALAEHLGVKYRGFLESDKKTGEASARILLANFAHKDGSRDDVYVRPICQPYAEQHVVKFTVDIEKHTVPVEVKYGLLDKTQTKELVMGEYDAKYYYTCDIDTQGFDIQLGQRTVATGQMESIWGIEPEEKYNFWTGCIRVDVEGANLPRGFFRTLSGKSDINDIDPSWEQIFEKIRKLPELKPKTPSDMALDS